MRRGNFWSGVVIGGMVGIYYGMKMSDTTHDVSDFTRKVVSEAGHGFQTLSNRAQNAVSRISR